MKINNIYFCRTTFFHAFVLCSTLFIDNVLAFINKLPVQQLHVQQQKQNWRNNIAFTFYQQPKHKEYSKVISNNYVRPLCVSFSSSDRSSVSQYSSEESTKEVIYQKVINHQKQPNDGFLVINLVEYLENYFQIPTGLPIIYESIYENNDIKNDDTDDKILLIWDSPLSTSAPPNFSTRMEVQVIAIYADDDKKKKELNHPTVPTMAMVVVKKDKPTNLLNNKNSVLVGNLGNLFQDSESRILKSLDRGLDDFMMGKMNIGSTSAASREAMKEKILKKKKDNEDAFIAELFEDENEVKDVTNREVIRDIIDTNNNPSKSKMKSNGLEIIDASIVSTDTETTSNDNSIDTQNDKIPNEEGENSGKYSLSQKESQEEQKDYAVQAAAATRRKNKKSKKSNVEIGDYAITAAKKAMLQSKKDDQINNDDDDQNSKNFSQSNFNANKTNFKVNINKQSKNKYQNAIKNGKGKIESKELQGEIKEKNVRDKSSKTRIGTTNDAATKTSFSKGKTESNTNTKQKKYPTEREISETAKQVLEDFTESHGQDFTPEELLENVLKYGKEEEKKDAVGSGFASAALEKAKDILQQQQRQRDERKTKVIEKTKNEFLPDIQNPQDSNSNKPLTPQEELRRMFQAGENLADSRLATTEGIQSPSKEEIGKIQMNQNDDEIVDQLISSDKSVSSYSRILDEDLAELEVAINKSPGEDLDHPNKNPLFDIFSGPEVYNQNVDLDTVNYPGAIPGTKNIRLPKELDEAVKQAEFARDVLKNLKTVEVDNTDGNGPKVSTYFIGKKELTEKEVNNLQMVVSEAAEIGLIQDPLVQMSEKAQLQQVLDEMWTQPEERFREIASNYKDLLLSENFVLLVKERLQEMADRDLDALRRDDETLEEPHAREREILGQLVAYAQLLLKEARALGAELEAEQLEVIRTICKVAMDPAHKTEEETAIALSDTVKDMRPLFDNMFIAYLKYAIAEEDAKLKRNGLVDDPEHNQWLFVLKIVQQGVYAEIAKGINRYLEHIWYVLRMETHTERKMLLSKLIDEMPTLDVRPFVQTVENIVGALGDSARGDFDGVTPLGEMTNKLIQLHRDMKELLPPERIDEMSRVADEWAAKKKEKLMEQRRVSRQRLKAARQTEHLDHEIEKFGRLGEMERFD